MLLARDATRSLTLADANQPKERVIGLENAGLAAGSGLLRLPVETLVSVDLLQRSDGKRLALDTNDLPLAAPGNGFSSQHELYR